MLIIRRCITLGDLEMQGIALKGNGQYAQKQINVFVVYRPPGGDDNTAKNLIIDTVQAVYEGIKCETIILGDLNWNCLTGNELINDLCEEMNLVQLINHPTRITHNRVSLLDIILTDMKNIAHSGCFNINVSDHLPIFIIKKRLTKPVELENIRKRSFKHYDRECFGDKLFELDWSVIDLLHDVNIAWKMLYKGMLVEADKACPYKEFRIRKNRPVWFTGELCTLGRERDIILRNYRRGGLKKCWIVQRTCM